MRHMREGKAPNGDGGIDTLRTPPLYPRPAPCTAPPYLCKPALPLALLRAPVPCDVPDALGLKLAQLLVVNAILREGGRGGVQLLISSLH